MQVANSLDLASHWLTGSGIVCEEDEDSLRGAVKGGYFLEEKRYDCVYHEINGYAISCFVNLYRATGDDEYLEYAKDVAEYLLSTLGGENGGVSSSAFTHSVSLPGRKPVPKYYAFDNAMIVSGLLDLYEAAADSRYYDVARRCAKWVVDCLQNADGSFHSYYDGDTGELWHGGARFDKDRSILHAKIAIPLLRLWRHSGTSRFLESADALLRWAAGLQAEDGAFWSNEFKKTVFTHSHCYSLEGFLYAHFATGKDVYREIAVRGIDWLSEVQYRDGSLNYQYKNMQSVFDGVKDRLLRRKTSDATAQAVRLWLLADAVKGGRKYRTCAERGVAFLAEMQLAGTSDRNVLGGVLYRKKESILRSRSQPVLYSWCTQFAVQAFMFWLESEAGNLSPRSVGDLF